MNKKQLEQLKKIPGVGDAIAQHFADIGIMSIDDLKGQSPEKFYDKLCAYKGMPVDRCMLYVFRCAIYFASNDTHDPELCKWWNWKD